MRSPAMIAELPRFNLANVDSREELAFGLSYADVQCRSAVQVSDPPTLLKEALACRVRLKADITTLIARREPATRSGYSGGTGYRRVAGDILLLVAVITENWTQAQGKCGCEEPELAQAEQLANRLLRRLGRREQAPATTTCSARGRSRLW